jgi:hypothetical protein
MYDQLEPVAGPDPDIGWHLLAYVNAIGEMFQQVADLAEDGDNGEPGWSIIVDINRIPDEGLPYIAQFIGMAFVSGIDAPTMRQQIRDHTSWQRGTPAALMAAVRLFLTGTKTVQMQERNPDAYAFQVIIWASEAPADTSSTSPLVRYVNLYAKPAGLTWTITVNPGTPPSTTYTAIYTRGDTYLYDYTQFQTYANVQ